MGDEWPEGAPDGRPDLVGLERSVALALLVEGELEILGRLLEASNASFYCRITRRCPDPQPDLVATCVYKPIRGERPLDDFPDGTLAHREVAAHAVSEAMGVGIVPPTVLRDGPYGIGMLQLWVDIDESIDVVRLIQEDADALRRIALFDAVVNNADRKIGHLLPIAGGHIFGVDHGVCFSPEPKLRTVLWGWRGMRFEDSEVELLEHVRDDAAGWLGAELGSLLVRTEVEATVKRIDRLLRVGCFPQPDPRRPALPWPIY